MGRREEDRDPEPVPPDQDVPPDYLAPVDPEDDEGFVGIDLEPLPGANPEREPRGRRHRPRSQG